MQRVQKKVQYVMHCALCSALCILLSALFSCSATKYVDDNESLLQSVVVRSTDKSVNVSNMQSYIRQRPNAKWLSLAKIPLAAYSLSGRDSTKWRNRVLKKMGEPPVIYDASSAVATCNDLRLAMFNNGFMHSDVVVLTDQKNKRTRLTYLINPGEKFYIDSVHFSMQGTELTECPIAPTDSAYCVSHSTLKKGAIFSINALSAERKKQTEHLLNRGYYKFNKEFIYFDVDSTAGNNRVNVTMHITPFKLNNNATEEPHPRFMVRDISYRPSTGSTLTVREKVLRQNTRFKTGSLFNASALQYTYNNFSRLRAIRYTGIHFTETADTINGLIPLNCEITLAPASRHSISFQPEGTNTAGNLGAAASLTYENRNLFHGSELFSVELRGAFEAITGLEGYNNANYEELGAQTKITLPHMMIPFGSHIKRRPYGEQTEIALAYNMQNRPEFHRRVATALLRYRWLNRSRKNNIRIDVLDLNYIYMPWMSAKFKADYLDNDDSRNAILRYNYDDLFIMKLGAGFMHTGSNTVFKTNVETAGNILRLGSSVFGAQKSARGSYTLFNIAYAQYVKGEIDVTHLVRINPSLSMAMHFFGGVAYPYGNSEMLPFEKRYFSGGANSVRGWNVRELGPGGFRGKDGRIDFINHSGDIRLDANVEFRSQLFWKFHSALFVDAGNIWTIKKYVDQPDGEFRFNTFYKQIAASYGIGLRINLDYFIVRFDFAMKALNPAYRTQRDHIPLLHPKLSRDLAFHFAVGMPF